MRDQFMQLKCVIPVLLGSVLLTGFYADVESLPEAISSRIEQLDKYTISDRINPFYLRGDFDADGRPDYAILIKERSTNKKGVVVFLSSQAKPQILGAGRPVQYGATKSDDLNFDSWRVYGRSQTDVGTGFDPPPGKDELILVQKNESASGFFRWSATHFIWIQQGD